MDNIDEAIAETDDKRWIHIGFDEHGVTSVESHNLPNPSAFFAAAGVLNLHGELATAALLQDANRGSGIVAARSLPGRPS